MGGLTRVLFSEVRGSVFKDGKPLSGAVVRRTFNWRWGRQKGADQTITDRAGEFHFPRIVRRSLSASFPHEPVIGQFIAIEHDGKEYVAWEAFKRDYALHGELGGQPINLDCELTNDPPSGIACELLNP